ncbi:MgtC/SapB family protein [Acerihabitans arboris]|uniref:Protein MgtC n=1 Tax=Acerihabitans arboris TaxID=2691583 RepID=A0A845SKP8_9GAMM|nr:MgtC/SapB family protein [Acerihabitans arboris]NDL61885.1 MgtC/SapB family protein [Acerihabitans arboris]
MDTELLLRIALAGGLGALIGLERQLRAKEAGLRTHILVCIGSAMFMIVSKYGFADLLANGHNIALDPSRISAQVVSGIGFLGAGTIMLNKQMVRGLTTAAGLWVTAAIGLIVGSGMYAIGIFGTLMTLVVLEGIRQLSNRLIGQRYMIMLSLAPAGIDLVMQTLRKRHIRVIRSSVARNDDENKDCKMTLEVMMHARYKPAEIYSQLLAIEGMHKIDIR